MIKTFIFDLGSVIVKVDKSKQYKKFATDSNKTEVFISSYFENSNLRKTFEKGKLTPMQFYNDTSRELGLRMNFKEFKEVWCDIFSLNKDVEKLILKLKKNFNLVLLSNTDILHFEYIKSKYKIINAFDKLVLSYEVGCRKPNPLIFLRTLKKAKTMPFNCVYIDDIFEFVLVAKFMGIKAFQYKNFEKLKSDLSNANILTKNL